MKTRQYSFSIPSENIRGYRSIGLKWINEAQMGKEKKSCLKVNLCQEIETYLLL